MTTSLSAPLTTAADQKQVRVVVIEPNAALRSAILTVLDAQNMRVEECESLDKLLVRADDVTQTVGLVAWQAMDGLLAEEQRSHLVELTRRVRLVLMVPRRWMRLLARTDLGVSVTGFIAKPIEPDELIDVVERAAQASSNG